MGTGQIKDQYHTFFICMQKLPDFANSENTSHRYFLNMRGEKVSNFQETFHMLIPNLFTMHLPLMLWRYPGSAKYL